MKDKKEILGKGKGNDFEPGHSVTRQRREKQTSAKKTKMLTRCVSPRWGQQKKRYSKGEGGRKACAGRTLAQSAG